MCSISLTGISTHRDIIGSAVLRLPAQRVQCGGLCPIWLHRPQALPLRAPATGEPTALMCISVRLVQQMQGCSRMTPKHSPLPYAASSQVALTFQSCLHDTSASRKPVSLGRLGWRYLQSSDDSALSKSAAHLQILLMMY